MDSQPNTLQRPLLQQHKLQQQTLQQQYLAASTQQAMSYHTPQPMAQPAPTYQFQVPPLVLSTPETLPPILANINSSSQQQQQQQPSQHQAFVINSSINNSKANTSGDIVSGDNGSGVTNIYHRPVLMMPPVVLMGGDGVSRHSDLGSPIIEMPPSPGPIVEYPDDDMFISDATSYSTGVGDRFCVEARLNVVHITIEPLFTTTTTSTTTTTPLTDPITTTTRTSMSTTTTTSTPLILPQPNTTIVATATLPEKSVVDANVARATAATTTATKQPNIATIVRKQEQTQAKQYERVYDESQVNVCSRSNCD